MLHIDLDSLRMYEIEFSATNKKSARKPRLPGGSGTATWGSYSGNLRPRGHCSCPQPGGLDVTLKPVFLYSAFQKAMEGAGAVTRSEGDARAGQEPPRGKVTRPSCLPGTTAIGRVLRQGPGWEHGRRFGQGEQFSGGQPRV